MTIYLNNEIRHDKKKVLDIQTDLEFTCVNDLLISQTVEYSPGTSLSILPETEIFDDLSSFRLMLEFSRVKLYKKKKTLWEICEIIQKAFENDIYIECTSEFSEKLLISIRLCDYEDDGIDANDFLQYHFMDCLNSLPVCGVLGIEKTFISEKNYTLFGEGGKESKKEFVIETDGINLKGVCLIRGVDTSRIICNDPQEMLNVFGLEIARETLFTEIRNVIADGGSYINYRHLALLCELMTIRGVISSITRHAMNKSSAGPLTKCTFEQSVDILLEAAKNGSQDKITGVSEKIMLGQLVNSGTGIVKIMKDENVREYDPCRPSYLV